MTQGRKFWFSVGIQLANTILLAISVLPSESYVQLTMFIMGGYTAANVLQKIGLK